MFKPASHPVFPHLIYLKDVNFKKAGPPGSKGKDTTTSLYRLDWENLDLFKQQKHAEWNKTQWPNSIVSIDFKLDSYYEDLLQSLRFALPHHYLDEIHEHTQKTVSEWSKERRFDTVIREMCLQPAIEHARVAFGLVCDCVFDEKTNYYLRADNKYILVHLLLYRFWMGQTGRGCVQRHAEFPWLKERLERLRNTPETLHEFTALEKFIKAIDDYETKLNQCYEKIQMSPPVTSGHLKKPPSCKKITGDQSPVKRVFL